MSAQDKIYRMLRWVAVLLALLIVMATVDLARGHYGAPRAVDQAVHLHFGHGALGQKALRVAKCESGWRLTAASRNGLYFGLFQFDLRTWRSNGGRGHPRWASAREQARVTRATWRRRGWQPWPVCGRR